MGRSSAWRRMISSSDMPVPKRSVREQRPPMERAAISISHGPPGIHAQLGVDGPVVQAERARGRARRTRATACWVAAGSRDGVT